MQEDIMTKDEFLYALKRALSGEISAEEFNENMRFYEEYIEAEIRKGRTEEDVMRSLGDPRLIAKTIIETSSPSAGSSYANNSYSQNANSGNEYAGGRKEESSGNTRKRSNFGRIRIFSGWKIALLLIGILLIIILLLVLFLKALGALFYMFGPLFVVLVLILLIQMKDKD